MEIHKYNSDHYKNTPVKEPSALTSQYELSNQIW